MRRRDSADWCLADDSLADPIEHGIVTNWDDMEKIWHHTVRRTSMINFDSNN